MKTTTYFSGLFFILITLILTFGMVGPARAACTDELGCVTIPSGSNIHIAYLFAMTGATSSMGIDEKRGVEIAIDDAGGSILGHTIQFDGQDGKCNATDAAAAGTTLAADTSIVAVIGTTCSTEAINAMPSLSAAGLSMVSPSTVLPQLTEVTAPAFPAGFLRTAWNDNLQGKTAANYAFTTLAFTTAAIIDNGGRYSTNMANAFSSEFTSLGGTITYHISIDPTSNSNIDTQLATISTTPDMLYIPVFAQPEGSYIIDHLPSGLAGTFMMGSDSISGLDVTTTTNEEGVQFTNYDSTATQNADYVSHFLPAYQTKYGEAPTSQFNGFAYDAFLMIKAAIESVAVETSPGTHEIGRKALRDALYATTNLVGLKGKYSCSATGDCANPVMSVYRFQANISTPQYIWPPKMGLVMDASGINDKGFNDESYKGILQAETDLGIAKTLYLSDSSNYQANLEQCANEGNGVCFGVGFPIGTAIVSAATAKPNTSFAIIDVDTASAPTNLRSITFNERQIGYLAGALAGKMTTTNVVGVVGGVPVPPVVNFAEGFRNGAQCANPQAKGLITYTNSFVNPTLGANTAKAMITNNNADVIFGAAGATGNEAILYSAQHGKWSVGVDNDQYVSVFGNGSVTGHEKILTSAMKLLSAGVYATIQDYLGDGFSSPAGTVMFDMANVGVGLAPYHDSDSAISNATKTYVNTIKQAIIDGTIDLNEPCRRTISGDSNAPGATITYVSGLISKTTYADNNGLYSMEVAPGWSGSITPSKNSYTFSPVKRNLTNITTDTTNQSFIPSMSFTSNATFDGWVLETSENSNVGGTMNAVTPLMYLGDDANRKQYRIILSFATAGLPDTAVITRATLKVKSASFVGGGNPVSIFHGFLVDIVKGSFGALPLSPTDFSAAARKTYGPFNLSSLAGWYSMNLLSGINNNINKQAVSAGVTQLRLRFSIDDNNDKVANYLNLYSGSAILPNRPQLIVEFELP